MLNSSKKILRMGCIKMKQKKVWLLVGIPGSGKSTWVNKKLNELEAGSAVVISRDTIRFGLLEQRGGDYFAY
ncbi:MAG: AAA family ATPase, partial [Lachnospiraceae bacterium]|nr:AAA family ATPase [Lachnospiraceae bacterium]